MKLYLVNAENIYFPQIKGYFREIISSYDNGNYRSAMVMLYSTIVCDLLLKLKELSEVYADTKAEKLLKEVNDERSKSGNSRWEWKLIEEIHKRTELINDETYAIISHIYDLRNFSAHPALDDDYELISPTPEMTVAYIKKALDNILTKPSVFAQNIVNRMSDDVAAKKELYKEFDDFQNYLSKAYFQRMSDKVITQVFKAFWKFTFINTEDETIKKNVVVNHRILRAMLNERYDVIYTYIKENPTYFFVSQEDKRLTAMCALLARFPQLYQLLDESVQFQIINYKEDGSEAIKWFIVGDLKKHIDDVKNSNVALKNNAAKFLSKICEEQGQLQLFNDLVVTYYAKSSKFSEARDRFAFYIKPYLSNFTIQNFVTLIESINNNSQLYNYINQKDNNDIILEHARKALPEDFDYTPYPKFEYTAVEEAEEVQETEEKNIESDALTD